MLFSDFDWDEGNLGKCQKHGVTLAEIEFALRNDPLLFPDYDHSEQETRTIAIGFTQVDRPVFVCFTLRMVGGVEQVRPISARFMHRKEIESYDIRRR